MKKFIKLAVIILLVACKSETNNDAIIAIENKIEKTTKTEAPKKTPDKKATNDGTYLCTINGKPWNYTKASGIVSRHKKTQKRTAIFTFTKQLEKGKETVQLFYDGDSNQLDYVNIRLKVPKKDGKTMTGMYIYNPDIAKIISKAKISGTIDLSHSSNASGNAEISDLSIRYYKEELNCLLYTSPSPRD